jgi:hypothetical protein
VREAQQLCAELAGTVVEVKATRLLAWVYFEMKADLSRAETAAQQAYRRRTAGSSKTR